MKSYYPLQSTELNDIIYGAYEDLTYLLTYKNESGVLISGYLDKLETSITDAFCSGVLYFNNMNNIISSSDYGNLSGYLDLSDFLRMDYIYRKHFETEDS